MPTHFSAEWLAETAPELAPAVEDVVAGILAELSEQPPTQWPDVLRAAVLGVAGQFAAFLVDDDQDEPPTEDDPPEPQPTTTKDPAEPMRAFFWDSLELQREAEGRQRLQKAADLERGELLAESRS